MGLNLLDLVIGGYLVRLGTCERLEKVREVLV